MKRSITFLTALTLSLSLAPALPASAPSVWCGEPGVVAPCVLSASVNGTPVTSSDPTWGITLSTYTVEGFTSIRFYVEKLGAPDPLELGPESLDDVWIITVNPGGVIPRVVSAAAADLAAVRSSGSVQVTATPVIVTDNDECNPNWPWSCPATAGDERVGYLDIEINDFGGWTNAAQRSAFNGMNYATNVGLRSLPPELEEDPATGTQHLLIRLANHHFRVDGTTVFVGAIEMRIPHAFLREVYGVDDPSTLTGTGITTSVTGSSGGSGTYSVTQDPAGGALLVEGDGITFSKRIIRFERGTITPTKPKKLRAKRIGATNAKLRFKDAKPRGSKVRRYQARCVGSFSLVKAWGRKAPLTAKLAAGDRYACRVRAKSKAGFGPWSKKAKL